DGVVRGSLRTQQRAVARPHRTLGPLVGAAGNLFEPGVLGNDLVECRIEPLNFLTGRRCCHERQAHWKCTESHARDCTPLGKEVASDEWRMTRTANHAYLVAAMHFSELSSAAMAAGKAC